jgi:phosphoglycolate phosphatase
VTPILFDLDRTLVDVQTYTDYAAALADVESLIGGWADPPTPPTGWDGPTRRAMGVLVALTGDERWQEVSDIIESHERRAVERSVIMPGVAEALTATGDNPRAVVTLLPPQTARVALRQHGLGSYLDLDLVVGRRSDLAAKPAPDQLLEGCRLLGVEPAEAVMIGDSTWDAVAAEAAGCGFVGVTNGKASEFGPRPFAVTLDRVVALLP